MTSFLFQPRTPIPPEVIGLIIDSLQSLTAEMRQTAADTHQDHFYYRLQSIVHVLSRFAMAGTLQHEEEIFALLESVLNELEIYALPVQTGHSFFFLHEEQLQYLLEENFTVREMSTMYSVSPRTIWRRMAQYQVSINRLIFARAVRSSILVMVSFWHPYLG